MRIETKEVREGLYTGETVWICHYLRPDVHKKALRNVPPTKVLIRGNEELPKNKTVYYSEVHFSPFGKNGKPMAKVISPVDNTGYRLNIGNELHVFTEKGECIKAWNEQLDIVIDKLREMESTAAKQWRTQIDDLHLNKKNYF